MSSLSRSDLEAELARLDAEERQQREISAQFEQLKRNAAQAQSDLATAIHNIKRQREIAEVKLATLAETVPTARGLTTIQPELLIPNDLTLRAFELCAWRQWFADAAEKNVLPGLKQEAASAQALLEEFRKRHKLQG